MGIILVLLSLLLIIALFRKGIPTLNSHWNTLLGEFTFSTQEFYELLEEQLHSHGISKISISKKNISIGNALFGKRLYLRVKWKNYTYDCCCAPFGKGTFISWYLYSNKTGTELLLSKIPFIGNFLVNTFFPITYYTIDTASMFMTYCQSSVLKVIDDITNEKGLRLSENERKPIMQDIFKR